MKIRVEQIIIEFIASHPDVDVTIEPDEDGDRAFGISYDRPTALRAIAYYLTGKLVGTAGDVMNLEEWDDHWPIAERTDDGVRYTGGLYETGDDLDVENYDDEAMIIRER